MDKMEVCISDVAIYLRKSRGTDETEKDLDNHRSMLVEICEKRKWNYKIYQEIGSGIDIDLRPEMLKLLSDVELKLFDAVLVVDLDRLGRGKNSDFERISHILISTDTYLCIHERIIDLNDDSDGMMLGIQFFFANLEYKTITKRLRRGKINRAKQGFWSNGIPPYPYVYEKWLDKFNEGSLVVNDDKDKIYREIIENIMQYKKPLKTISEDLNKRGIPGPRGGYWNSTTIWRLALDQTHLGKIIINKSKGNGHKKRPIDAREYVEIEESQWIIVDGKHEAIKTQEEHEKLLTILKDENKPKTKPRAKKLFPLSGLIRCGKCGKGSIIIERKDLNGRLFIKKCWYVDPIGNKCDNSSGTYDIIEEAILDQLFKYEENIIEESGTVDFKLKEEINININEKFKILKSKEMALEKVFQGYEADAYSVDEFKSRKAVISEEINDLNEGKNLLELKLKHLDTTDKDKKLDIIKEFKKQIKDKSLSNIELNELYNTIIESISWERNGDDININIKFL